MSVLLSRSISLWPGKKVAQNVGNGKAKGLEVWRSDTTFFFRQDRTAHGAQRSKRQRNAANVWMRRKGQFACLGRTTEGDRLRRCDPCAVRAASRKAHRSRLVESARHVFA